jgi:hypothetical protein
MASGETETSTPDLSSSQKARREDASGDLSRAGEDCWSSRLEVVEGEDRMEEPVRSEVSMGIVSGSAVANGARLTRAGEANLSEVIVPPPTIGEAASGEVVAADMSSDLPGQEDTGVAAVKMTEGNLDVRGSIRSPGVGCPDCADYYVHI